MKPSRPISSPLPELSENIRNQLEIEGVLSELGVLRHSPAGLPILSCALEHGSRQVEAGIPREVKLELQAVALGDMAHQLSRIPLGSHLRLSGFLAARSMLSRMPVLHIATIEFLEGTNHGIQARS